LEPHSGQLSGRPCRHRTRRLRFRRRIQGSGHTRSSSVTPGALRGFDPKGVRACLALAIRMVPCQNPLGRRDRGKFLIIAYSF
jgi:hypothetical protein